MASVVRPGPAAAAALICGLFAAGAAAGPALQGNYRAAASSTCLLSPLPFDSTGQPTNPNLAFLAARSLSGTFTFDGQGGGQAAFKALTVAGAPTAATAAETDAGKLHYKVTGSTATIILEHVAVAYKTGPEAGLGAVVDKIALTGGVSADGSSLTLSGVEPSVETTTVADGSVVFSVCETAGSLVKM